ncbi:hypothetical protein [Methylophaga sulfidovorans]|uniref:Uncharacterized protein n=1 Tax=Methylophaga sulfidovorans TaxID=45496 RepID=A0A1I4A4Y3_9GAMM|nr:hypothetical protein [Methylophaga sulfidovorans]SFK51403.1 hypothetical protein SAMN04488079_11337 [Methylophaga sulfidovorans]
MKTFIPYFAAMLFSCSVLADDVDMAGLQLGMSIDEAKAALLDHGVNASVIEEEKQYYTYSDGAKTYKTPSFIHSLSANIVETEHGEARAESFELIFMPLPKAGRLVAIHRVTENHINPVTVADYRQSLIEQYGQPFDNTGPMDWIFPQGKLNCLGASSSQITPPRTLNADTIMGLVFKKDGNRYQINDFRNPEVKSLDECANWMSFQFGTMDEQPASNITATMIDVPGWINAYEAAMQWVGELKQEAIDRRNSGKTGPQL